MIYFTADTHFFHENILRLANRPWPNVEEMHDGISKRWNSVVTDADTVYHLGDVAMSYGKGAIRDLLKRLKGRIILISGNHDHKKVIRYAGDRFEKVYENVKINGTKIYPVVRIKYYDQLIVLGHYAMRVWDKSHYGTWHLYGHSHGSLPDDPNSLSLDVGVDANDFTPLSYHQVAEKMRQKSFRPVDHHGR